MQREMARSAAHPRFQAVHVAAAVRGHAPALPERRKSAKIRTGSAVHMNLGQRWSSRGASVQARAE
jgi:hypothetical protein